MAQKMLTKELLKKLPPFYATEKTPIADKKLVVKFFTPWSNWTWYGVEYDPDERTFFGFVVGHEKEWGYFSLDELESCNVERDYHWDPETKFSDLGVA